MNAELNASAAPILKTLADSAGPVLTGTEAPTLTRLVSGHGRQ